MAEEKIEPRKVEEEKAPAESTPKVKWWQKVRDGAGNAIGEWFSNR